MNTLNQLQSKIEQWHKTLNHRDTLPERAFRRNVAAYELVSYVNHIIACYVGGNFQPIRTFIERIRTFMQENPDEGSKYYSEVESYLSDMELFLENRPRTTKR